MSVFLGEIPWKSNRVDRDGLILKLTREISKRVQLSALFLFSLKLLTVLKLNCSFLMYEDSTY